MIFVLEFLWSPRLHVCHESHYNSDLTAYFASSQKVGQVQVHLVKVGFSFFPRLGPLYQQSPLTLAALCPRVKVSRARGLRVQGRGLSVLGSEYRIEGLRAQGSGFGIRVQSLG